MEEYRSADIAVLRDLPPVRKRGGYVHGDIIANFPLEAASSHRGHSIGVSLEGNSWTINVFDFESRAPAWMLVLTSEHPRQRFRDLKHACEWGYEWVDGLLAEEKA